MSRQGFSAGLRLACSATIFAAVSVAGGQQASTPALPPAASSTGPRVIFSRSWDDAAANSSRTAEQASAEPVTDAERQGITFLSYDLEAHLQPAQQAIAVRARMILRNDGSQPLRRLPLQISSSLNWIAVRVDGQPAVFSQQAVNSDADHTGILHEAVITLAQPVAPKQTIAVDATYQGTIERAAQRLEHIGAPSDVAADSDWDRVSGDFIGLRGFGNVVWYPVVSVPVALGDGDKFFTEVADQKQRQSGAMVSMEVTEEFLGSAPNLAVLDGKVLAVKQVSLPSSPSLPGIATCTLPKTRLGFAAPSLFLLDRTESAGDGLRIFARPQNGVNAQAYRTAASMVAPLVTQWLGARPKGPLNIVDLPEAGDAPFEADTVLFTGINSTEPDKLTAVLVHSLAHAYFASPYPWLDEGVAYFLETLWVERTSGRDAAIAQLDNARSALSLVEPAAVEPAMNSQAHYGDAQPGKLLAEAPGETLIAAKDAVYYRTKATYVFWMLRSLAGDDALAEAFRQYDPSADASGVEFERVLDRTSHQDLKWFFADWVYHDRGLPDLSIAGVHPNSSSIPGSFIVAVDVANSGGAAADVPVSVRSGQATVTQQFHVPANSSVTRRFLLVGQPIEVAVNDGTVPETVASVHRRSVSDQP